MINDDIAAGKTLNLRAEKWPLDLSNFTSAPDKNVVSGVIKTKA